MPAAAGVVVLHAWWGRNGDVLAFADRLRAAGFEVEAPDMFAGQVTDDVEEAERLAGAADEAGADAAVLGAIDALAARLPDGAAIGVVGFSFGAAYALWCGAKRPVAATVVYYGTMLGPSLAASAAPVLGHFAADDPFEPAEGVVALEAALREAGRAVDIHRYPDTGHWFAEPSRTAFRPEAAELAFERTVAFLRSTLLGR